MSLYKLILIIVFITLIYNIIQNNNNTTNIVEDNSKKKKVVSFDLNKNTIYEISNEFNEDPKHIKNVYGEKVLNNNSKYSINNIKKVTNPQDELINRLNNNTNDLIENFNNNNTKKNIFIDQKSYWNSLNIGNFTERDYLNKQTNDFNIFKNNNNSFQNKEISKIYDNLTIGTTNLSSPLMHDDNSIMSSQYNINGFSKNCDKKLINNIEN